MDQPPLAESTTASLPPGAPATSLFSRLINVFAAPGEVFDEVKAARTAVSNWIVPALIASVIGAVSAVIIFSQPTIQHKMREQQERAMDDQVKAGKMTQQQADQALEMAQKFAGPAVTIFAAVGAVVVSFVRVFWWGLVLWLIGKLFFKATFPYMKAVEVAALSSLIVVLGSIVSLLLTVILGKMFASASLALLVGEFDMKNKMHFLLAAVNVFNFWLVGVMGLGLSRLAGAPFLRAMLFVLGYWIAASLALIAVGMGHLAL